MSVIQDLKVIDGNNWPRGFVEAIDRWNDLKQSIWAAVVGFDPDSIDDIRDLVWNTERGIHLGLNALTLTNAWAATRAELGDSWQGPSDGEGQFESELRTESAQNFVEAAGTADDLLAAISVQRTSTSRIRGSQSSKPTSTSGLPQ